MKFTELHSEGGGSVLEVFEEFGLGGGGELGGLGGVVGSALGDHGVEDAGELVGGGDDAFGFAEAAFHAAGVVAEGAFAFGGGFGGHAEGGGHAAGDAAGFGFEDAASADAVVGAEAEPGAEAAGVGDAGEDAGCGGWWEHGGKGGGVWRADFE